MVRKEVYRTDHSHTLLLEAVFGAFIQRAIPTEEDGNIKSGDSHKYRQQ